MSSLRGYAYQIALGALAWLSLKPGERLSMCLGRDGAELMILLAGGTKKRQQDDIKRAKYLFAEYRARKAAAARPKRKR